MPQTFNESRYTGKPFLKLVDSWLLDCIGHLDDSSRAALAAMTPRLHATYGGTGTWQQLVRERLQYDVAVEPAILGLWQRNQALAQRAGATLSPLEFVEQFVANNITTL